MKTPLPPVTITEERQPLRARFVVSGSGLKHCPKPDKPEHAFIGRSNVGKSSLINMLVGQKELARTSSQPGKTRLINHFLVEESWYLTDLPGYGYARVSKTQREQWPEMIRNYLLKRLNLLNTFVLLDARLEPQAIDLAFIRWMGSSELPFCLVFTKCDKPRQSDLMANVNRYKSLLLEEWEELPPMILTSAVKGTGREELLRFIQEANLVFTLHP
ncbi:MAG TPA: ribosome biogenesis GTP-binding protein YihA/YsxC [Bacteroidales bacterium]|nr:ribosome biogenesis GTP-binding protein YihA/YsxC [Bacteroidales bacterium]HRZ48269.1 ribosome biogenesis GTP-binding protein YihA/YsxC [Bacteroidales bacterium]